MRAFSPRRASNARKRKRPGGETDSTRLGRNSRPNQRTRAPRRRAAEDIFLRAPEDDRGSAHSVDREVRQRPPKHFGKVNAFILTPEI